VWRYGAALTISSVFHPGAALALSIKTQRKSYRQAEWSRKEITFHSACLFFATISRRSLRNTFPILVLLSTTFRSTKAGLSAARVFAGRDILEFNYWRGA
jgi:hypothetical protein